MRRVPAGRRSGGGGGSGGLHQKRRGGLSTPAFPLLAAVVGVTLRLWLHHGHHDPQDTPTRMMVVTSPDESVRIRKRGCHLATTPLIFYHVPKTGGGTVVSLMAQAAHQASVPLCWSCVDIALANQCPGRTLHDIHTLGPPLLTPRGDEDRMKALRAWRDGVVVGHYNYGLEYAFLDLSEGAGEQDVAEEDDAVLRVVQLREPGSRVVSEYMMKSAGEHRADDETLASFLPHLEKYDAFVRGRLVAKFQVFGKKGASSCLEGVAIPVIRLCGQTCIARLLACEMTPAQALARAVHVLRTRFAVVGTTEEMGRFLKMLARRATHLASLEHVDPDAHREHENSPELKAGLKQALASAPGQAALAASKVVAQEQVLYAAAVEVMWAQWEELKECAVVEEEAGVEEEARA